MGQRLEEKCARLRSKLAGNRPAFKSLRHEDRALFPNPEDKVLLANRGVENLNRAKRHAFRLSPAISSSKTMPLLHNQWVQTLGPARWAGALPPPAFARVRGRLQGRFKGCAQDQDAHVETLPMRMRNWVNTISSGGFPGIGGLGGNRTPVRGFAVLCVATPPRGLSRDGDSAKSLTSGRGYRRSFCIAQPLRRALRKAC